MMIMINLIMLPTRIPGDFLEKLTVVERPGKKILIFFVRRS